jgi:hypothetical protein
MNSMPAASKAPLTPSNVDERLGGTSSTASKRLILAVTPAFFANCSVVQRRALLAERIWKPVIIDSRRLIAKNQLSSADAQQVEDAFAAKLGMTSAQIAKVDEAMTALSNQNLAEKPTQIDKSTLVFPEPRRIRDRDHLRHIMKQACLICSRRPSDPHHLRFAQSQALGRKVSDEFTVPLCRVHHREVHRCGDEAAWWKKAGVDPTAAARVLWLKTHPLPA